MEGSTATPEEPRLPWRLLLLRSTVGPMQFVSE